MNSTLPLVSLVCSAAADEDVLQQFHSALFRVLRALEANYQFEIVYVAPDQTSTAARGDALAQLDPRIRVEAPLADGAAENALHPSLANPNAAMVVLLDIAVHPPEVVPQLLEAAKGPGDVVEGVPQEPPLPTGLRRIFAAKLDTQAPRLALFKRSAMERLPIPQSTVSWFSDLMNTPGLAHAQLPYVPNAANCPRPTIPFLGRAVIDLRAAWQNYPLASISYFGATVFAIGVFLAIWFTVQGMIAPGSVWFSWCYLIVLLHILGGSTLYALGKVGTLATRILERVENQPKDESQTVTPASRNAA